MRKVALTFNDEGGVELDKLKERAGHATDVELFRHALAVYEWMVGAFERKHEVLERDPVTKEVTKIRNDALEKKFPA